MSDYASLYAILLIVYLSECVVRIDGEQQIVLFWQPMLRHRIVRNAGTTLGGIRRFLFLHPFPWLSVWYICPHMEVAPGLHGLFAASSIFRHRHLPGNFVYTPYEKITEKTAFALRKTGLELPGQSGCFSAEKLIETLAAWFDPEPIRRQTALVHTPLLLLRTLCSCQFVLIFLAAPLLVQFTDLLSVLLVIGGAVWLLGICIGSIFFVGYARLAPERKIRGAAHSVWLALYPMAGMRSAATLCRYMSSDARHEVSVALAVLPIDERQRYLQATCENLRRQDFPLSWPQSAEDSYPFACYCQAQALLINALALQNKDSLQQLLARLQKTFEAIAFSKEQPLCRENSQPWSGPLFYFLAGAVLPHWNFSETADPENLRSYVDEGAIRYCPLCALGFSEPLDFCPHCIQVRTLPVTVVALLPPRQVNGRQ